MARCRACWPRPRWFEVLEDRLLVHRVDAFTKSATRRLVQHPKAYVFDVGVRNGLLGNSVASSDRIGRLFEHLVYSQLVHSAAAFDEDVRVSALRTEHGAKVDFIVERGGDLFAGTEFAVIPTPDIPCAQRLITPVAVRRSFVNSAFLARR